MKLTVTDDYILVTGMESLVMWQKTMLREALVRNQAKGLLGYTYTQDENQVLVTKVNNVLTEFVNLISVETLVNVEVVDKREAKNEK